MAGVKRGRDAPEADRGPKLGSPYVGMFERFRSELDEHHDRREKVIKNSRDITASSKKVIFVLQRSPSLGGEISKSVTKGKEYSQHMSTIQERFESLVPDLTGIDAYRYQRQISPGIQEYMEAVLFQHFLETQSLLPLKECGDKFPASIPLTEDDYTLGLFDMSGELMRYAITQLATGGDLAVASPNGTGINMLQAMQGLRVSLEALNTDGSFHLSREIDRKLSTTKASVEKVEMMMYSMTVRGRERPKGWNPGLDTTRESREEDV